jgi:molybdate transport system substrate-binding protein
MASRFALLALFVAGCGHADPPRGVRVAAAANLRFAFDDLAAAFAKQHPDVPVRVTYGSSGQFAAQIANRAPFDVFLSADADYPRGLADRGFAAPADVFAYAAGRLAVWVPTDSPLDLDARGLAAVADPAVRKLAVANPRHAPYGRLAEDALRKAGLFDAVRPRLVFGENVEQAAQAVHAGAADAGLIPVSLAGSPNLRGRGRAWTIPADLAPPLQQAGVILTSAADRPAAEALRDFILGPDGQAVLERHGYDGPGG